MVKATLVGSFPKPEYLFKGDARELIDTSGNEFYKNTHSKEEIEKAVKETVEELESADLDVITDGEVGRDHYIHYHLRHWDGVDYKKMGVKKLRSGGKWDERPVPRIIDKLKNTSSYLADDYKIAAKYAKRPIKVNLPGPSTLVNFVQDEFYKDKEKLAWASAKVIHGLVRELYEIGCREFQFDDPVLMRDPEAMDKWGKSALEACFEGLDGINTTVHVCRGYPNKKLEAQGIKYKADERNYEFLLKSLQNSRIDQISIEAEQGNLDLSLLKHLGSKTVLLGVINVGSEELETVEHLVARGEEALKYISKDQLCLSTDCGMLMLPKKIALQKLINLSIARDTLNDNS